MVERYRPVEKQQLPQRQLPGSMRTGALGQINGSGAPPRMRPQSAMGVSGISVYGGFVRTKEKSADWVGTKKWETIADLSVNVSIVAASVQYFLNMVAHPQWTVKPAEDQKDGKSSKEAEELAEFVEEVIHDMTTPWQRVVRRAGMYRFNGFGLQEWIAKKRPDGKIGLLDIEPRPPFTIERWEIDEDGTVLGVWQRSPQTAQLLGLPRGKLIYIVDDTLTDAPDGLGVYRMLGEPFNRLKQYLELEARAYERDMRGIPVGRAPVTFINNMVTEGKITKQDGDAMIDGMRRFIQTQVRDKDTSLLLDSQPYENQTDAGLSVTGSMQWDVSLLSGGVTGLGEMANAIDRLQREMARIIGTENLMMGDTGGNRALSQDKSRNLYLIANSVLANVADSMDHDLIEPLWILNGFDPELKPYFSTEDVAFKDAQEIAGALAQMAQAGAVLAPDDPAIDDVRDLLGIAHAPEPSPMAMGLMPPPGVQTPPKPAGAPPPKGGHPVETDDSKARQVAGSAATGAPNGAGKPAGSPARAGKAAGVGKAFNPDQERDEHGRWAAGGGGGGPGGALNVEDYAEMAMGNLGRTSRTAQGTLDVSASAGKEDKLVAGLTGQEAKRIARENFDAQVRELYYQRNDLPRNAADLEVKIDRVAEGINEGIVRPGEINRTLATKFDNQTDPADLPIAKKQFASEFAQRLADPKADPVETAAWVEWRANIMDHFWADGVGKTAKALAAVPLMRAGLRLPAYPDNKTFYDYARGVPKVDPRDGGKAYLGPHFERFRDAYASWAPVTKFNENHDAQGRFSESAGGGAGEGGTATTASGDGETTASGGAKYPVEDGRLTNYTPTPAANASELFNRTYDPNVTSAEVFAMVSPDAAAKAAATEKRILDLPQTQTMYMEDGKYIPEREALHNKLLDDTFTPETVAAATPAEGEQPTLYILGGRGGSGKSWFEKSPDSPFATDKTVMLNSDNFKAVLPEYKGWNAAQVHEESSDLVSRGHERARESGLNVTLDGTLRSTASTEKVIQDYVKAGYKVEGYYMHTAPQVSAVRAVGRFMGPEGRYVPVDYILSSTKNEANFDRFASKYFSNWAVYDNNSGGGPKLVAKKKD